MIEFILVLGNFMSQSIGHYFGTTFILFLVMLLISGSIARICKTFENIAMFKYLEEVDIMKIMEDNKK